MKKNVIIGIVVVLVIVLAVAIYIGLNKKDDDKNNRELETAVFIDESGKKVTVETNQNMKDLVTEVYKKVTVELPNSIEFMDVEKNAENITAYTGIKSTDKIKEMVVSEPMMSAQAYSFVLVKVAKDADIDALKEEIVNNINFAKWVCVQADKIYVTNCGDIIAIVMANSDWAKPVYDSFKAVVENNIGTEKEKDCSDPFEGGFEDPDNMPTDLPPNGETEV